LHELGVVRIKAQPDDVDRFVGKGDGNFGAGEVGQRERACRGGGPVLSTDLVMVGEGPQFDPEVFCALGQDFGGERSVRDDGVAVQVSVENGHTPILRGVTGLR